MAAATGYGALPYQQVQAQTKPPRQRINMLPIILCLLAPWGLFTVVLYARSFDMHYNNSWMVAAITFAAVAFVVCLGLLMVERVFVQKTMGFHEPSWLGFLFLTSLLAVILSIALGEYNFQVNMQPYYDVAQLKTYLDVDPVSARGQALMDAGRIVFQEGTHLDLRHSMGFKHDDVYCVAPITAGSLQGQSVGLAEYDFWAIGKNCCDGSKGGDFHCNWSADHHARGGLRLLNEAERPYFRLAVQQAEATFNIKALHPVFLYWMYNPLEETDSYESSGRGLFWSGCMGFFAAQSFFVFLALFFISKLSHAS
eukprot:TRINITY_DN32764_c0_g1_i1.p1 TRINITY_DN32764_c0_g1~~TRINITY_DN32764_c0_g1_i1.p1  ORF type:complete len:311 (-),score=47.94 TRINITY_DN32764_c0_g1_i1:61-993(-)